MPFSLRREKALPDIPVDVNETAGGDDHLWLTPYSKITTSPDTGKVLPSIRVENTLSEEEMICLHQLWNGAGLSARAHRRKRGGNRTPRRTPDPISIPVPGNTPPPLPSVDPPTASTTPSTGGIRKRRGFLSARPFFEKEATEKGPSAIEILCAMAHDRLKKKLRYAKSAPTLGDKTASPKRALLRPAAPMAVETVQKDAQAIGPCTPSSSGDLATPEAILQLEDMDENAIYFTIDPTWHASRGSVQFQFITPIPTSCSTALERPDSPLMHRHFSLDQLSFAAQQATKTLTSMEFPEPVVCASDEILHLIDELHAYLTEL